MTHDEQYQKALDDAWYAAVYRGTEPTEKCMFDAGIAYAEQKKSRQQEEAEARFNSATEELGAINRIIMGQDVPPKVGQPTANLVRMTLDTLRARVVELTEKVQPEGKSSE